ncbi:MAG: methenyltetrahydromethanopterin cyclohydrolase [Candidatus Thorarchaeota archaeon]|nr:MAG: methenyltetrahydromethanopterin cyclohydrolase [Candidatus Thorarchaeota archaeon]
MTLSVNEKGLEIVKEIMDRKEELNCAVSEQGNGATLIDAGIEVAGGIEAGRLLGEICLGGLGTVRISDMFVGDMSFPAVIVSTDHPKVATLGSQYAGWVINVEKYFAMGSGPARALAVVEKKLYEELDYKDKAKVGVILLETRNPPPENVTDFIAEKCGIPASELYCVLAPTACIAGSVQISARIVEVGVHKLHEIKFDPDKIKAGHGVAPIGPVAKSDNRAMGITNDCILYAGRTFYFVTPDDDDDLEELVKKVPSSASEQYGKPFYDLFKSVEFDFYKVDPLLFSPAEVTINDIVKGRTYKAGALDPKVLKQSFGL